ncbi:hypothetical protein VP01_10021g1 [Puccinia sorghi]|uniref:Uncharacterized protein n=1 Tax=Puccinia sorghi TaxID=27349 RepID=A0A0L6VVA9_9BASI|nr:hypothetical protein VP01_10021g1 [Puccinia sorghi]
MSSVAATAETRSYRLAYISSTAPPLFEVEDSHKSKVLLLLTKAASKPIVLDSGAPQHIVNNPENFHPTTKLNIKISTGGNSNSLNATTVGPALVNQLG